MSKVKKKADSFYSKYFGVITIIEVIILILVVAGLTYAVFIWGQTGKKENTISTSTITFSYTENTEGIKIENSLPISDTAGKTLQREDSENGIKGYFDFSISCSLSGTTAIQYEIYAVKQPVTMPISDEYIKIYLTNADNESPLKGFDGVVPTYSDLTVSKSNPSGKHLYSGTFNEDGVRNYRLRMWLADTYVISKDVRSFSIKVNVHAND